MSDARRRQLLLAGVALGSALWAPASARADESPRELIRGGNERYRAGEFPEAQTKYQEARDADPRSLEAVFNEACARYRQGDLDEAERLLRRVDSTPGNPGLAAAAKYNLGRLTLDRLQKDPPKEPSGALERLGGAASMFRGALDLVPDDADAARNLELTRRAIQQLREQIKKQQELQDKLKQLGEQLKQNQQDQQDAAQQTGQMGRQQPQDPKQQQQAGEAQRQIGQKTKDVQDKLEQVRQEAQQQAGAPQNGRKKPGQTDEKLDAAAQALEEAQQEQADAEKELDKGDTKSAQENQQQAADRLQEALERLQQQQADQEQQSQSEKGQPQKPGQDGQPKQDRQPSDQGQEQRQGQTAAPTENKAGEGSEGDTKDQPTERVLARVLDKEKRDRARLAALLRAQMGKRQPVEKDW